MDNSRHENETTQQDETYDPESELNQPDDIDFSSTNLTNHEPQIKFADHQRDEEVAGELTPEQDDHVQHEDLDEDMGIKANSVVGWIALALSIASFFMMPVILGGAGIVLGFVARSRDAEWIGNTAIVAGIISIIITMFIIPFV